MLGGFNQRATVFELYISEKMIGRKKFWDDFFVYSFFVVFFIHQITIGDFREYTRFLLMAVLIPVMLRFKMYRFCLPYIFFGTIYTVLIFLDRDS